MGFAHIPARCFRFFDLHQIPLADTRAVIGGSCQALRVMQNLGPKRKRAALHRLHRVNGAALATQKMTGGVARRTEADGVLGANDESLFKFSLWQIQVSRNARDIGFAKVHQTFLLTTADTSWLTGETNDRSLSAILASLSAAKLGLDFKRFQAVIDDRAIRRAIDELPHAAAQGAIAAHHVRKFLTSLRARFVD